MKYRLLEWLVCPQCRSPDLTLQTTRTSQDHVHHSSWETGELDLPGLNHSDRELIEIEEKARRLVVQAAAPLSRPAHPYPPGGGRGEGFWGGILSIIQASRILKGFDRFHDSISEPRCLFSTCKVDLQT